MLLSIQSSEPCLKTHHYSTELGISWTNPSQMLKLPANRSVMYPQHAGLCVGTVTQHHSCTCGKGLRGSSQPQIHSLNISFCGSVEGKSQPASLPGSFFIATFLGDVGQQEIHSYTGRSKNAFGHYWQFQTTTSRIEIRCGDFIIQHCKLLKSSQKGQNETKFPFFLCPPHLWSTHEKIKYSCSLSDAAQE